MSAFRLIQVAYVSTARGDITREDVDRIVSSASRHNPELGITGILIWRHHQFFQLVEGPELAIDFLLRHIRQDTRHSNVVVIHRKEIKKRNFGTWSLGYADGTKATPENEEMLEAVMAEPKSEGLHDDDPVAALVDSFRRGFWDVR